MPRKDERQTELAELTVGELGAAIAALNAYAEYTSASHAKARQHDPKSATTVLLEKRWLDLSVARWTFASELIDRAGISRKSKL